MLSSNGISLTGKELKALSGGTCSKVKGFTCPQSLHLPSILFPTYTSQPAFGIKKARLLSIKMCNIEEQSKIVSEIEDSLSICDNIEQTIDTSLQQAEAMRQSILKQAFEGRLL